MQRAVAAERNRPERNRAERIEAPHQPSAMQPASRVSRPIQAAALAFALVYPTVLTWFYFVQMNGRPPQAQQAVFLVGKTIQFAFPAVWLLLIERRRIDWRGPTISGFAWGIGSGLLIAAAMLAVYFGWLMPSGLLATSAAVVRQKLFGMGLVSPTAIVALSLFYSLVHSLLEEYYWRWFVFDRLRSLIGTAAAIGISSLGFMAHHVILLHAYLPGPWWQVASAGVAIGGVFWAWLYLREGSLWAPWISHMLVDAAIFAIGFQMAFAAGENLAR